MSHYEITTLLLQAITGFVVLATLIVYHRQLVVMTKQLKTMQESSQAANSLILVNYLQSPDVRNARRCVREVLSKKHLKDWTEDERKEASLVVANYDVVAALLKAGLSPSDLIVTNWAHSIKHCYEILKPFINEYRNMDAANASFWSNFEWLYTEATKAN